jgi:hypothetical protein
MQLNLSARISLIAFAALTASTAFADEHAHVHGAVSLDVAVEGKTLSIDLESPLDNLLGFEHKPNTPAQRTAADALLKQMKDPAAWLKPDAAAQCTVAKVEVVSAVLEPGAKDGEHADLDASYAFSCAAPEKLTTLEVGLFDAFKRVQRINAQVVTAGGQSKQSLKRPQNKIKLSK